MKSQCHEVRPHLIRYTDNDLPVRLHDLVEEHLEHCYWCSEQLHEIVGVLDGCRHALRHPAPRNRFEELRTHLHKGAPEVQIPFRRPGRGPQRMFSAVAVAAVLLMVATVGNTFLKGIEELEALSAHLAPIDATEVVAIGGPVGSPLEALQKRVLWARILANGGDPLEGLDAPHLHAPVPSGQVEPKEVGPDSVSQGRPTPAPPYRLAHCSECQTSMSASSEDNA